MNKCLAIFRYAIEIQTFGLHVMTFVGDKSNELVTTEINSQAKINEIELWISSFNLFNTVIQDNVTDLGAELYPPLETTQIEQQYEILRQSLLSYFELMSNLLIYMEFLSKDLNIIDKLNNLCSDERLKKVSFSYKN